METALQIENDSNNNIHDAERACYKMGGKQLERSDFDNRFFSFDDGSMLALHPNGVVGFPSQD